MFLALALGIVPPATPVAMATYKKVPLCEALEEIKPGEILSVEVMGVYEVDYEFGVFFDPEHQHCTWDVDPTTWVEFASNVPRPNLLERLLEGSRRARVTFRGKLYGPGAVLPDDPALPYAAALANRFAHTRYGHLNSHRTQLVVEEIGDVAEVPRNTPWEWGGKPQEPQPACPVRMDIPAYPEVARKHGFAGTVVLEVTVREGAVTSVTIRSGDRVLSSEAVKNVRTWKFEPDTSTVFSTSFEFQLERRRTGESGATRVELSLPAMVRITAAAYGY
jgi:TonB family protein